MISIILVCGALGAVLVIIILNHILQKKKKKLPKLEVDPDFPLFPDITDRYYSKKLELDNPIWDEVKYQEFKKELKRLKNED